MPSQTAAALEETEPRLQAIFPKENATVAPDMNLIMVFSRLVNASSIWKSFNISNEFGVEFSVDLTGECGDATTLTFGPIGGLWDEGNYTLRFFRQAFDAFGIAIQRSITALNFTVSKTAEALVVLGTIVQQGTSRVAESGVPVVIPPGAFSVELSFSRE